MQHRTTAPTRAPRPALALSLAGIVAAAGAGLQMLGGDAPPLDLRPYLPAVALPGLGLRLPPGDVLLRALLVGLSAGLLCLIAERLVRLLSARRGETAAFAAAATLAALPAWQAFGVERSAGVLLPALDLALAGGLLALQARPVLAITGSLLVVLAAGLHPILLGFVPGLLACLWAAGWLPGRWRPCVALAGLALAASALASGVGSDLPAAAWPAVARSRLDLAGTGFLALPALAADAPPRALLATGYEALAGLWPVWWGGLVWGLLTLVATIRTGRARSGVGLAVAACPALLVPWVVPDWIPGDLALVAVCLVPAALWLAVVLGTLRGVAPRAIAAGLAVGLLVVSALHADRGRPWRQGRLTVMQIPHQGGRLAPDLEPDPTRLGLFIRDHDDDFGLRQPLLDALVPGAPVLDVQRLRDLLRAPSALRSGTSEEQRALLRTIPGLRERVESLQAQWSRGPETALLPVAAELEALIPDMLALHYGLPRDPQTRGVLSRYEFLLRDLTQVASVLGRYDLGLPLREALVALSDEEPTELLVLGREFLEAGHTQQGRDVIERALERAPASDPRAAVARGALGRLEAAEGRRSEGLELMNRAWSELSRSGLASALQPVAHDFWLVTELLLARYGIAREIDPDLAPQARRDLVRRLDPALAFGLRRVPALLFRARVHLMEGEPHRARALLAELDALRTHSLVEQGEGAVGRLDHPRWRLEGLRLYRELAGPDLAPEARADLDARITDLEAR